MRIGISERLYDILLSSICSFHAVSMVAGENLTNYRQKNGSQDLTTKQKDGIMVVTNKNLQRSGSGNHE